MTSYTLDYQTHVELKELIEDTIEYFCDDKLISGELTWLVVQTLAEAKLAELKGEIG